MNDYLRRWKEAHPEGVWSITCRPDGNIVASLSLPPPGEGIGDWPTVAVVGRHVDTALTMLEDRYPSVAEDFRE